MKRILYTLAALVAIVACQPAWALGERQFVRFGPAADAVVIAGGQRHAELVVDAGDHPGVLRAVQDLQADIGRVTGKAPVLANRAPRGRDLVLVGTLGKSALIDRLAREGKIDGAALRGKWEGYLIQAVRNPLPGVARALVVAGSDKRGTIYGVYTLSEQIGVSPWYWWADVPVKRSQVLAVPMRTRVTDAPVVRYRGIFLNDEAPALSGWAKEKFGGFNHRFYEKVFELILRLRGNYIWPAMWGSAFYDDDPQNGRVADEMGVIVSTSHHEPMMRAHDEWRRYGKGPWDYSRNPEVLKDFWRKGLQKTRDYEKVITLGMRGDGDEPMSEGANVALLERIVADQREIIRQETGKPVTQVPQVWALYKEVQEYYEKGMRVPDDVTLLWCDDNWGNIRRLPTPEERKRPGGAGVYYHFDYVGGPRSYKWINVTPLPKVWEQMHLAWRHGADRLWIVNVGDLKPMEVPIEFFLTYAWNPAAWPAQRLPDYLKLWATREFGPEHAGEIAELVERYAQYNGRRRPEQLEPGTYSALNYRESERVVADYNALAARAVKLARQLKPEQRDAFFQLVQYPVHASSVLNDLYGTVQRNRMHAAQGRADTNDLAARARSLFDLDAELSRQYHQDIAGGKWNHMMSQTRIGYTTWSDPKANIMPEVRSIDVPENAAMGVAVEGSAGVWPAAESLRLPALDPFEKKPRYIEVFNRGRQAFEFAAHANVPWIVLSQSKGTVDKQQRIEVDVRWDQVPRGAAAGHVIVTGPAGAQTRVDVPLAHDGVAPPGASGFVETGGVVAIEAQHHARAIAPAGREWMHIPGLGRTLSGVSTQPVEAAPATIEDGMRLEYDVHLFKAGKVRVHAVVAPTLKFRPGPGLRFAVSFDDQPPKIVDMHADVSERQWARNVSDGVAQLVSEHEIDQPGGHTLKFWALDPGVVLQRLVIDTGGLKPSYLGPPESPRVSSAPVKASPRQRLLINDGWRFHLGDPGGNSASYLYDVRPEVKESADGKAADAMPEEAARVARGTAPVLKPWILPSGNAFIKDAARRHVRPAQAPAIDAPFARLEYDDRNWRAVRLPHDWAIEGPFLTTGPYGGMGRLKTWGPAWYRKKLAVPASDSGKSIFLDVDGAMSYASVWVNGQLAGGWPYGYNSFRIDLTPYIKAGAENQLAIRLDNPPESARWYPGAGLYRNVWLTKTEPVHVAQWGVHVWTPKVSAESAQVAWKVTLDNDGKEPAAVSVTTELYVLDETGRISGAAVATVGSPPATVNPGASTQFSGEASIAKPRLWGPRPAQTPHRYTAVTTVRHGGRVVDRHETPFGIRSLRFDPDSGIYVNGEKVPIRGVNNHHDLGALGAAFNVRAAQRQLEMLQEMGANAVRMSHNPPDPQLLELTDRMGMLVVDEIFDSWERKKTPLDFHLIFPEWHEQDLRAMMRRDRNHPSIVMWSVGNEVGEQYTGEDGARLSRRLVEIAREEDDSRPFTNAMNYAKADMPLPATVDVIGLNYQGTGIRSLPGQFPMFRAKFPNKVILHLESAAALSSRGEYQFPVPGVASAAVRPGSGGDPRTQQVSAYELFAADFGSSADRAFAVLDQNPYTAGEFVWTGWDYLGEPTPYYGARSSYFGIIDLAGFKKDRFYLYQSRWRPELPMVHILPHWTWPERVGQVTPVHVFTSGDEAELFVNGKSQGRQKKAPYAYRLRWDYVSYEPGELKVVAYKDGKEWAKAAVRTAAAPAALEAGADRATIAGDGRDLSFVTVRVVDRNGITAPRANQKIRFRVDGPAELVATDNGDPTSFVSFQSPERPAFNGLALGIVRAKPGTSGPITVRVEADGLKGATVALRSTPAPD